MNNYKEIFESSVTGLLEYLEKNKLSSVVLGISGGIDSTVCAVICSEAVKRKPGLEFYGVSLPCKTNQEDEVSTADKVGKAFVKIYWEHRFQVEFEEIERWCSGKFSSTPLSKGNIKARLRMIYLRNLAGLKRGIVIDTDNKDENFCGFFTIAGDQGDLSLIAELWKTEIYKLAEWIVTDYCETEEQKDAVRSSIGLTPTDGNGVAAGGDLAQIAPTLSSYSELEEIIKAYLGYKEKPDEANLFFLNKVTDKYGEETVNSIIARHKGSEFKRTKLPIVLSLSGIDREEPRKEDILKHVSSAEETTGK